MPEVGCTRVSASCRSVVLPAPFGPRITQRWSSSTRPVEVSRRCPVALLRRRRHRRTRAPAACRKPIGGCRRPPRTERCRVRRRSMLPAEVVRGPLAARGTVRRGALGIAHHLGQGAARSATNCSGSSGVPVPSVTCSIGTSRPVTPSTTTSGMPPVALATTAAPHGHRLEVHDAQRLVDGRADERGCVR